MVPQGGVDSVQYVVENNQNSVNSFTNQDFFISEIPSLMLKPPSLMISEVKRAKAKLIKESKKIQPPPFSLEGDSLNNFGDALSPFSPIVVISPKQQIQQQQSATKTSSFRNTFRPNKRGENSQTSPQSRQK